MESRFSRDWNTTIRATASPIAERRLLKPLTFSSPSSGSLIWVTWGPVFIALKL